MKHIDAMLFDLDGVLVDACDWHYEALNRALTSIGIEPISREDHLTKYNGLPTAVKLDMLGLHEDECALVWKLKQDFTLETIAKHSKVQEEKIELFEELKKLNVKVVCVTNSIRETATEMLRSTGQLDHIEFIISNEDVENNKPEPDCYNFAVKKLDTKAERCIIVEDSPKGLQAAESSDIPNKNIWRVQNSKEVTLENMRRYIDENFDSNGR
ncbi:HAD-IA family hydrolase [Hyphomonas sp.]|uniref:HAD family hydrolase n=1 Tax=Hyphomonas sp. TaxID=87 RepID=UPI000C92883C|nr:HAD-IA family hydrolase [Hyphomonas sp.]MAL44313.1 HAD family hydrolase [Hyphomonas sp.]